MICISFMIFNAFVLISEYLKFSYELKLIISNTNRRIDFPAISVCTESNVLFDKKKVFQYFDLTQEYENSVEKELNATDECNSQIIEEDDMLENFHYVYRCLRKFTDRAYIKLYNKLRIILMKFELIIFEQLSFDQMTGLTISSDELFECSAAVHFKNQTIESNAAIVEKCSQRFRISRDIYANNNFGICYKFFDKNYGIYLKNDDYIKIKIKLETRRNFMAIMTDQTINLNYYFGLYYFVDDNTNRLIKRYNAFETTEVGFKSDVFFKTVSFEMLSTLYMEFCLKAGKNYYFKSGLFDKK